MRSLIILILLVGCGKRTDTKVITVDNPVNESTIIVETDNTEETEKVIEECKEETESYLEECIEEKEHERKGKSTRRMDRKHRRKQAINE